MPAPLASLLRRLGAYVRGFSSAQRTVAIIGIAVVVLGGVALASWLGKPSYAPLFTGLQPSDASAVVDQLTTDGVPYQLEDGGSSILVPQDKVYSERLKAASNNLPSSTTSGYALLDNLGVTSSQFQQDVTYKEAMEEELANTIQAMNGVKTASVKLAIPQESVFTSQTADPTASVFIATAGNQQLTDDQVQAIVHLTSASVPEMKASDVTVVDAQGETLSTSDGTPAGDSNKTQSAYDTATEQSLQKTLDAIVGPGNSTVAVSAVINSSTAQSTEKQFSVPTGSPAATESVQNQSYAGSGSGSSTGVLGPDNIAVPSGGATDGTGSYTDTSDSKTNALNEVTTNTTTPPGSVTRQTVSVAVSQKAAQGVDMSKLTKLVQSAAGYDPSRGDTVTVQAVAFSTSAAAAAQNALAQSAQTQAAAGRQKLVTYLIVAGTAAAVIIAIIVFALAMRRRRPVEEAFGEEVIDAAELSELLPAIAAPQPEPLPETLPLPRAESAAELELRKRELSALATSDPSHTANALRALMEQEVQL